jgi:1-aminocyclopropane-1-carboxylate deaminase
VTTDSTEALLQQLDLPLFEKKKLTVFVLRLDRIHPFISGNKFYKLKYNLEEFSKGKYHCLLTFGGAYSNHIAATAAAGKEFNINTIGIIRGDELNESSNEVLQFAVSCGMKLFFVSRCFEVSDLAAPLGELRHQQSLEYKSRCRHK